METTNKIDVTERIKSIEDALNELGDNHEEVIIYKKLITVFDHSCHLVNYQAAVVLTSAINEGWVPDWDNNEWKYQNYFVMGGSSGFRFHGYDRWASNSYVGSRLCFIGYDCMVALTQGNKAFIKLWNDYAL